MMRRKKRKSSKTRSATEVAVEIMDLPELSDSEMSDRFILERKVERAFYEAGTALAQIRDRRLYRNTHLNFESYCRERFQFTRDSAYLKIAASEVYKNLEDNLPTIGRQPDDVFPLPINERQLRPIVKAQLEPSLQVEVWSAALEEANGKRPSGRIVKSVIERMSARTPVFIPFEVGEVCAILPKDNPELRGKGGCWCIVSAVGEFSCTVGTYDRNYQLRPEYLKSLELTEFECKQMEDLGVRMTQLYQTGELEEAARGILKGLAKLDRAYLSPLEEQLLRMLEKKYCRQN